VFLFFSYPPFGVECVDCFLSSFRLCEKLYESILLGFFGWWSCSILIYVDDDDDDDDERLLGWGLLPGVAVAAILLANFKLRGYETFCETWWFLDELIESVA